MQACASSLIAACSPSTAAVCSTAATRAPSSDQLAAWSSQGRTGFCVAVAGVGVLCPASPDQLAGVFEERSSFGHLPSIPCRSTRKRRGSGAWVVAGVPDEKPVALGDGLSEVEEPSPTSLRVGSKECERLLFVDAVDRHQDPLGAFDRGATAEGAFEVVVFGEASEDDVERGLPG